MFQKISVLEDTKVNFQRFLILEKFTYFEQLDPCEEHNHSECIVELSLEVSEPVEVSVSVTVRNQSLQLALYCPLPVDRVHDTNHR